MDQVPATTSLVILSLHLAVCLHRAEGEVFQVWDDAKIKVGPVRFTRTYPLTPLSLNLRHSSSERASMRRAAASQDVTVIRKRERETHTHTSDEVRVPA